MKLLIEEICDCYFNHLCPKISSGELTQCGFSFPHSGSNFLLSFNRSLKNSHRKGRTFSMCTVCVSGVCTMEHLTLSWNAYFKIKLKCISYIVIRYALEAGHWI
jgi:hypothetical protein